MPYVLVAPDGYVYWCAIVDGHRVGWSRLRDAEQHRAEAGLGFTAIEGATP